MTSSWAVEVSRSTADWARSGFGHVGQPLAGVPVGRDHGAGLAVSFDDDLVDMPRAAYLRLGMSI
jgi:hypothetical protein